MVLFTWTFEYALQYQSTKRFIIDERTKRKQ